MFVVLSKLFIFTKVLQVAVDSVYWYQKWVFLFALYPLSSVFLFLYHSRHLKPPRALARQYTLSSLMDACWRAVLINNRICLPGLYYQPNSPPSSQTRRLRLTRL